jgi:tRNA 2-thiocytidine biosynthesis protein TtcA
MQVDDRYMRRKVGLAIGRFRLLEEGDRVLVAISGGKDSLALLDVLLQLQRRAPVRYELVPFVLDQGFPGFDLDALRREVEPLGVDLTVESAPVAATIARKRDDLNTVCALCSRLRRGHLYQAAPRLGCNKIALGHHADDIIETLLLGIFFNGQLGAMPPVLLSDDGRNTVIRPLCYAWEEEIDAYCRWRGLTPVKTPCPEARIADKRRQWAKQLFRDLAADIPFVKESALAAVEHLRERFLLDPRFLGSSERPSTAAGQVPPSDASLGMPDGISERWRD